MQIWGVLRTRSLGGLIVFPWAAGAFFLLLRFYIPPPFRRGNCCAHICLELRSWPWLFTCTSYYSHTKEKNDSLNIYLLAIPFPCIIATLSSGKLTTYL
ncbi:hypothetical protein F4775DRAFT_308080 [Biscogniauxia sp. FL1348]|nr:hypothetical protein F4775DRAFT_308080 [Biscogniauxia sp. FL1348]